MALRVRTCYYMSVRRTAHEKREDGTMTQEIARKTIATANKMNTDWPVIAIVERQQFGGQRPQWTLTTVCNGVSERFERFATRREAMDAFDSI